MTYSAPNASDTMPPGSNLYYHIKTGATGTTVTVVVPGTLYGTARPDIAVVISTNTDRIIGPLIGDVADPATGLVTITTSSQATCTCALLQMGA
jgi:hypothetical protein